jgi:hypothetical protein
MSSCALDIIVRSGRNIKVRKGRPLSAKNIHGRRRMKSGSKEVGRGPPTISPCSVIHFSPDVTWASVLASFWNVWIYFQTFIVWVLRLSSTDFSQFTVMREDAVVLNTFVSFLYSKNRVYFWMLYFSEVKTQYRKEGFLCLTDGMDKFIASVMVEVSLWTAESTEFLECASNRSDAITVLRSETLLPWAWSQWGAGNVDIGWS